MSLTGNDSVHPCPSLSSPGQLVLITLTRGQCKCITAANSRPVSSQSVSPWQQLQVTWPSLTLMSGSGYTAHSVPASRGLGSVLSRFCKFLELLRECYSLFRKHRKRVWGIDSCRPTNADFLIFYIYFFQVYFSYKSAVQTIFI